MPAGYAWGICAPGAICLNLEEDIMKWITSMSLFAAFTLSCLPASGYAADVPIVSPEAVADYIYAVIQNHRTFYTNHVVQLLEEQGVAKAGEEWATNEKTIPLPVQVINETSQGFATKFSGLRYQLISLWPINVKNTPHDQLDRSSLEGLRLNPERRISRIIKIQDQAYFHAIYPDIALSQSCVSCHNSHPNSPKKDFQVGDIMGGLVIEFPVGSR